MPYEDSVTGYGQPTGSGASRTFNNGNHNNNQNFNQNRGNSNRGRRNNQQTRNQNDNQNINNRNRTGGSAKNKQRSNNRMESYRHDKSKQTEEVYQTKIKEQLFIGTSSVDDALARLGEIQTLRAITLSITTRGIGFGISQTYFTAISIHENIVPPSCFSMYRIFLAMLEAKLEIMKHDYPLVSRDATSTYPYTIALKIQHLAKTVTVAPTPIVKIMNALGIVKRDGIVYIPAVLDVLKTRDDLDIPCPETVLYSNLRRTVLALANAQTPERYRIAFEEHNPIPGAIFENHILQNPDEIMPGDFNLDTLQKEVRLMQPFLIKLQKHAPKLVGGIVDFKTAGKNSLFISNAMEDLRQPPRARNTPLGEWYASCLPDGNVSTFYSRFDLPAADRLEGQINLLGEFPDRANIRWPFYSNRDSSVCPFEIASDYHGIHQIMYGN